MLLRDKRHIAYSSVKKLITDTPQPDKELAPAVGPLQRHSEHSDRLEQLLEAGQRLGDCWSVADVLSSGSFGQVYIGRETDTDRQIAIKAGKRAANSGSMLDTEIDILVSLQGTPHAAKYYGNGHIGDVRYIVMQLLGRSLAELKKSMPSEKFSPATTLRLAIQMIESVEHLHDTGYLHRDVKPGNFVMGNTKDGQQRTVYLIDFGLARRYMDPQTKKLRPARGQCSFRGTYRYASINSLKCNEQCRADDMRSVFYSLLEMLEGQLPWRGLQERTEVLTAKLNTDFEEMLQKHPSELKVMYHHLQCQSYDSKPNYAMLERIFALKVRMCGVRHSTPFDWELIDDKANNGIKRLKMK